VVAEPYEPGLGAGARRKALGAHVQRFEQVGLAGAVRADDDNKALAKLELEGDVRAKAPERDPLDDQPASLIGMIR
jgi:hypothetical protein